ncbi:hypothetical protein Pfo_018456 [Paulownia fortunei]|nr:hypothetical protein Pfo_018456 [Paulownia fortunei]
MSEISSDVTPISTHAVHSPRLPSNSDSYPIQITTIRFNGDNFLCWSQSVRLYIRGRGKISYLTGDTRKPVRTDPLYSTWDAENSMVIMWLVNSMEDDIGSNYMCYSTAKELWDNVTQMYSDLSNQSQYELTLKLGEIRQGNDTVTKYFNSLKRVWQDLDLFNDYEWKCPDDCSRYRTIVDANRVFKFLAGLNMEFDGVRARILGRNPLPSINEVFSEVRREETLSRNVSKPQKNDEKPGVWCDHCNKPRHTRKTCWKVHGKPDNWKPKHKRKQPTVNEAESNPFSKEQIDQLLELLKSNPIGGTSNCSLAYTELELGTTIGSARSTMDYNILMRPPCVIKQLKATVLLVHIRF